LRKKERKKTGLKIHVSSSPSQACLLEREEKGKQEKKGKKGKIKKPEPAAPALSFSSTLRSAHLCCLLLFSTQLGFNEKTQLKGKPNPFAHESVYRDTVINTVPEQTSETVKPVGHSAAVCSRPFRDFISNLSHAQLFVNRNFKETGVAATPGLCNDAPAFAPQPEAKSAPGTFKAPLRLFP
jgi:hypothetical protein